MRQELQNLCEQFIANRDEVKKAFKLEYDDVYPICANIFLSHNKKADEEAIRACKDIIKENAGVFNNFRGSMYAPAASILACAADPDGMMEQASANYKLLKEHFMRSDSLVLAALILTDMATSATVREKAERGRKLYLMMKEKHRFLPGDEDSVFAVLTAFSDKSDEEIIAEDEKCYELLKGLGSRDALQAVAHVLAMSEKPAEEKCARLKELFESVRAAGMKYGKDHELSVLAALSLKEVDIPQLVSDIADVSGFLKMQKGYKSIFGADQRTRLMHAAMLVSTHYAPAVEGDVAALASMLMIIAIHMMVMMCIVMSHSAIAASTH